VHINLLLQRCIVLESDTVDQYEVIDVTSQTKNMTEPNT